MADSPFMIGHCAIGDGQRPFFAVEEGQANNGNFALALRMISLAETTGADAIEFQLAIASDFYVRSHPNHAVYKAREFSYSQLVALREAATEKNLLICASPLSDKLVPQLAKAGYSYFNINSSDIVNGRMLDAVSACGMPLVLGTAMANIDEIDWAVERLSKRGSHFALLHGQHIMATAEGLGVPVNEASLSTIGFLRSRYGIPVGFTDHTASKLVGAFAVCHGAVMITKHLAPEAGWRGADWQICLAPDEMRECVDLVHLASGARGSWEKNLATAELADRKQMRRSVVAAHDLPAGTTLCQDDLLLKRPGTGVGGVELDSLVGRKLRVAVSGDDQILPEHLI